MTLSEDIDVVTHSERIDRLLARYAEALGEDYKGYRGHVYRVLSYALHFLGGESRDRGAIETALVYHDIGLWTDREIAYLEPSIRRVKEDNAALRWGYDPELLSDIIFWHHKLTPYRGPNAEVINAVRKADWIDATAAVRGMGMPKACIDKVTTVIPAHGFYQTLRRIGPELTGSLPKSLAGLMKVYKL